MVSDVSEKRDNNPPPEASSLKKSLLVVVGPENVEKLFVKTSFILLENLEFKKKSMSRECYSLYESICSPFDRSSPHFYLPC
jgi:hypothetical protein